MYQVYKQIYQRLAGLGTVTGISYPVSSSRESLLYYNNVLLQLY